MAENKKAFTRYRVIDQCLRNTRRFYSARDLRKEVKKALEYDGYEGGIGKTQLSKDLEHMRESLGAPIVEEKLPSDRRISIYKYSDADYSILKQPLNEDEKSKIKEGLMVLSQIRGLEQFEWIDEILPSIEEKIKFKAASREVISYDFNVDYSGLGHINNLFNAINQKRVLKIEYQSFKESQPTSFIFHPYHLRQYNSRWYVFGFNQTDQKNPQNLALDRIVSIQETNNEYIEDETNWFDFFSDFVGVTKKEDEAVDVKLLFSKEQAPYIITKPLHGTQNHTTNEDGTLEVTINVIPNFELESLILSYGERVKVLEPESLKHTIKKRLNQCYDRYREGQ
jgi:predicted DNA-binding transcriptional regulator YafY